MPNYLNFFYKFYQTCETSQRIDLSEDKNEYLLPLNHPNVKEIQAAVQELQRSTKQTNLTMVTHLENEIYSIKDAPNWLLRYKTGERFSFIQDEIGPKSSDVLRVVMNRRIKKIVQEKKLNIHVPNEYLVQLSESNKKCNYYDFCVTSEKLNILSYTDTINTICQFERQKQLRLANDICKFIYHTGYMDSHMANIVLTQENELAVVDTEGQALFCEREEYYSPIALSEARIVGLKEFIQRSKDAVLPEVFINTAENYLLFARIMHIIKIATILLSIICPIIPLVVVICSVISAKLDEIIHASDHSSCELPSFQNEFSLV